HDRRARSAPARRDPARGRAARARGRHAPLLRPGVDGTLARGQGAVPRPQGRRAQRPHPNRAEGARADDEARAQAGRARAPARADRHQAEGRLLPRLDLRLVPRADGRRDRRLPPRPFAALRGAARAPRRREARPPAPSEPSQRDGTAAAVDSPARGLVVDLPAARDAAPARSARGDLSMTRLRYAVITPVLDEEDNIGRVAECLARQSRVPQAWIVVDTGSSDGTRAAVEALARTHSWIRLESIPPSRDEGRAPPIVRALHHGLSALPERTEIVV